jgi:hypothetical protein
VTRDTFLFGIMFCDSAVPFVFLKKREREEETCVTRDIFCLESCSVIMPFHHR